MHAVSVLGGLCDVIQECKALRSTHLVTVVASVTGSVLVAAWTLGLAGWLLRLF